MNIIGNGVDIIDNSRIKRSIKKKGFLKRIYSNKELIEAKKIKNKVNFFAKRFAAKEAFVKSLGTGFRNGINFKDISINNDLYGKPKIQVSSNIKQYIKKKLKVKNYKIFLSLADEKNFSIAYVIINIEN